MLLNDMMNKHIFNALHQFAFFLLVLLRFNKFIIIDCFLIETERPLTDFFHAIFANEK